MRRKYAIGRRTNWYNTALEFAERYEYEERTSRGKQ